MNNTDPTSTYRRTWEAYALAWKKTTPEEKRELYGRSLSADCVYTDPLTVRRGWDELVDYMLEFHRQIPGGHFHTVDFIAHHDRSVAHWEMRDGEGRVLDTGTSYGEYDEEGKLTAMTGFYRVPEGNDP